MNLSPLPIQKFFGNNGRPLDGGLLFTYVSGTTTKIATYKDASGGVLNTNPIVLDFRGECRLWIDPTKAYTFVLAPSNDTDPPGNPFWTVNDITVLSSALDNAANDTGSVNGIQLAIPAISSPVAFTRIVFKAANTNTGPTTITINGGTAKALTLQNISALTGTEIVAGGVYQAIFDGAQWQLQDLLGFQRTSAEITAAVTIINNLRAPGDVERYGSISDLSSWTAAKSQFMAGGSPIKQLPVSLTYFGGTPNNAGFDNTAAFNTAISFCASLGYQEIFFPGANNSWYFNTQPNAMPVGITLRGENSRSFLIRNYTAGSASEPFLNWDGSMVDADRNHVVGGGIENLGLLAGTSTTLGAAIVLSGASSTSRPGFMHFRDVQVTGNGSWSFGILVSGANITTAGSQGMRDHLFSNVQVFRCSSTHVQVSNGVHIYFQSLGVFDGGLGGTPLINITGGGAADSNSNDVHIANLDCAGDLTIQNCVNVSVVGRVIGTLTIDSSATNVAFIGTASTLTNTCSSSVAIDSAHASQFNNGIKLKNSSIMDFSAAVSASATAGGGGALPATPVGYLNIKVDGNDRRVPYYAT